MASVTGNIDDETAELIREEYVDGGQYDSVSAFVRHSINYILTNKFGENL